MNKLILLTALCFSFVFADSHDINQVAIDSYDMNNVTCLPSEANLTSKKAYIKELKKYGIFAYSMSKISRFTLEHYEDLLFAAKLMPSWLKLGVDTLDASIRVIYRHKLNSVANAFITLGPKWFKFDKNMRRAIIFHELAHRLDTKFYSQDNKSTWKNIESGWRSVIDNRRRVTRPNTISEYVSEYAMTNSVEDWAESVSAYRLKPELLKRVSLKKYNFLKNYLFLGQEFINEESCKLEPSIIDESDFNIQLNKVKKFFLRNKRDIKRVVENKKNKVQPALYFLLKKLDENNPLSKSASIDDVLNRYSFKLFIQNTNVDSQYPVSKFINRLKKL